MIKKLFHLFVIINAMALIACAFALMISPYAPLSELVFYYWVTVLCLASIILVGGVLKFVAGIIFKHENNG